MTEQYKAEQIERIKSTIESLVADNEPPETVYEYLLESFIGLDELTQDIHVAKYYGGLEPVDLLEFIESKVQAGIANAFLRCTSGNFTRKSTSNTMFGYDVQAEIIVCTPVSGDGIGEHRASYRTMWHIIGAINNIGGINYFGKRPAPASINYLFRFEMFDVSILNINLNGAGIRIDNNIQTGIKKPLYLNQK